MLIFNLVRIVICAIAFGIAFVVGHLMGTSAEGSLMIIAGPIVAILDLVYRAKYGDGNWFIPEKGGSLFFLPAWGLGVLWLVLGIIYTINGSG